MCGFSMVIRLELIDLNNSVIFSKTIFSLANVAMLLNLFLPFLFETFFHSFAVNVFVGFARIGKHI